jgi:hypothetical protein
LNEAGLASIIVASIGTVGTVVVALLHRLMKTNASDHDNVTTMIGHLHGDVKRVDDHLSRMDDHVQRIEGKLDGHIDWHLKDK